MAKLQVTGRVIALSQVTEIPSREAGKPAMKKRELYLDMTMYDPYTGERSERENKPLLEFGGDKVLEKLAAQNIQRDDVVTVSFAIQGTPYKDQQTGKTKVFTAIRCYDIEMVRKANQCGHDPAAMPPTNQTAQQPSNSLGGFGNYDNNQQGNNGNKEEPLPF